jgi:hypothetical protein
MSPKTPNTLEVLDDGSAVLVIKNYRVLISSQDIPLISAHSWNVNKKAKGDGHYVTTYINGKSVNLNGLLTGSFKGHVLHKDGDSLNFRRENLESLAESIEVRGEVARMKIDRKGVEYCALFDATDVQKVLDFGRRWSLLASGYVYGGGEYFHRFLLDVEDEREVDHKNQDHLDNRRENLLITTPKGNAANRPNAFAIPGRYAKEKNPYRGNGKRRTRNFIPEIEIEGDIAYISLTQGQTAIIDSEDIENLPIYLWMATWNEDRQSYYARMSLGGSPPYLHQVITNTYGMGKNVRVDHIDGDTLNCRRSNLRVTNASENGQNRTNVANRNSKTGIRNVYYHKTTDMYEVKVMVKGKGHYGGWYPNTEEGLQQAKDAATLLRMKLHTHSDGR